MKAVLIDTNIVIDIALEREPFYNNTKALIELLFRSSIPAFLTASSVTDI